MESARDRLLETAADLFYREGITATGVDRIVRVSGVSKPTLYAHFGSKDALLVAVLERRCEEQRAEWQHEAPPPTTPAEHRILAFFDWLASLQTSPGYRGCAFLNAAAELAVTSPAAGVVRRQKRWMCDCLADLARQAGAADPDRLAQELVLLIDGANVRTLVADAHRAAGDARRIAAMLLEAEINRSVHRVA